VKPWRCFRPWAWPSELRRAGIMGMNARNLRMLAEFNPRRLYPRVDDKLITKRICETAGIPVPETLAVIERFGDVSRFEFPAALDRFVIKPARGAAGRGVMVVTGRTASGFATAAGEELDRGEMRYHLAAILSGLYSLGGRPDRAVIEQLVAPHPAFEKLAVGGTPDLRVVVHRGEPVMAMLRLPTRASRGRANLHQGAVGAGVDVAGGVTLGGVCRDRTVDRHPDTGEPIVGFRVPAWAEVLEVAATLGRALELGYCGVDVVLDARRGPLVLEANARPGLGIQTANRQGLAARLAELGRTRSPAAGLEAAARGGGGGSGKEGTSPEIGVDALQSAPGCSRRIAGERGSPPGEPVKEGG
jgi:alpha-L-glutamate ligase-like protein